MDDTQHDLDCMTFGYEISKFIAQRIKRIFEFNVKSANLMNNS